MALRSFLLSAVVGVAALGAFHSPAAQAGGSVSISVGTPHHGGGYYGRAGTPHHGGGHYGGGYGGGYYGDGPYNGDYRGGYDRGHRAGAVWVPGHWVSTYRGRVFVQGQYVRAPGHGYDDHAYDNHGYDRGYYGQPVYRNAPLQPLPGGFYHQRGGNYPGAYYPPRGRGW